MKKSALLVVWGDISLCRRAQRRYADLVNSGFNVSWLCNSQENDTGASAFIAYKSKSIPWKIYSFLLLLLGFYSSYARTFRLISLVAEDFDLVVCYDLVLIPLVRKRIKFSELEIDVREYYSKQFEDDIIWKITFGRYYRYLMRHELPSADFIKTVSPGLVAALGKDFDVKAELSPSYSDFIGPPAQPKNTSYKLMHHGVANKNRNIELYFKVISLLPHQFELDLFLVETDARYMKRIRKLATSESRVRIIEGLDYSEVSEHFNRYDIGLFLTRAVTFNLDQSWPNKVFDYLSQGMWVVATPLAGIRDLARQHGNIRLTDDCSPQAIASTILSCYETK